MVVEGSIIAPDGGIEVGVTPRSHEGQVLGDMHRMDFTCEFNSQL